jgi:pullulanase/glycogen debranching enzyme
MELLGVEVGKGKVINFEVYVFDTGDYLRHGKWEQDSWWYWGQSKVWKDPAAMHVDFNNPQKKLDATAIKKQQDDDTAKKATAAAATAASQAPQNAANAPQAPGLFDRKLWCTSVFQAADRLMLS